MIVKLLKRKYVYRIILISFLVPLWVYLRSVYRDRLGAFGCFDDCFNIVAGYFIGQGKQLYSQIFFNHQPIPAYISFFIQTIYHPQSIYELIYRHRMMLIGYFALADVFLTLRFGLHGFAFALLFETTKSYVFGERFIAESMIVYPLVYLLGLAWESLGKKRITIIELLIASFVAWFVIFSREPYIPLAAFLYLIICVDQWPRSHFSLFLLFLGSFLTLAAFDVSSYWWNLITVNLATNAGSEIQAHGLIGFGFISIFLYPIQVFFGGTWNHFRWLEVMLSAMLIGLCIIRLRPQSSYKKYLLLFLALGLANIRPVTPGTIYYVAFHHLIWYALAIATVVFLLGELHTRNRVYAYFGWAVYTMVVGYAAFSPQSYLYEQVDRVAQFGIGYGHYITQGEIIRRLSDRSNTLFLEEWDDLIYWQAKRIPSYPYGWYTSFMNKFPIYRKAREEMFANYPPDFYYGQCDKKGKALTFPDRFSEDYVQLAQNKAPICLFVRKRVIPRITTVQWDSVLPYGVHMLESGG